MDRRTEGQRKRFLSCCRKTPERPRKPCGAGGHAASSVRLTDPPCRAAPLRPQAATRASLGTAAEWSGAASCEARRAASQPGRRQQGGAGPGLRHTEAPRESGLKNPDPRDLPTRLCPSHAQGRGRKAASRRDGTTNPPPQALAGSRPLGQRASCAPAAPSLFPAPPQAGTALREPDLTTRQVT